MLILPSGARGLSDERGRRRSAACGISMVQFHLSGFSGNPGQLEYVVENMMLQWSFQEKQIQSFKDRIRDDTV